MIILVLETGYWGRLTVKDRSNRILFNDSFPSSRPTIFFTKVLTNGLNMSFSSTLEITEIEVFGGMYLRFIYPLYNMFRFS